MSLNLFPILLAFQTKSHQDIIFFLKVSQKHTEIVVIKIYEWKMNATRCFFSAGLWHQSVVRWTKNARAQELRGDRTEATSREKRVHQQTSLPTYFPQPPGFSFSFHLLLLLSLFLACVVFLLLSRISSSVLLGSPPFHCVQNGEFARSRYPLNVTRLNPEFCHCG